MSHFKWNINGCDRFMENRLIMRFGGRASAEGGGSASGKEAKANLRVGTEKKRTGETRQDLDQAKKEVERSYFSKRGSYDDLDLARTPRNPRTKEKIKEGIKYEGLRTPEQVALMQRVQDTLDAHLLNPAAILILEHDSDRKKAVELLYGAMKNPNDLDYSVVREGVVEVTPVSERSKDNQGQPNTPDDFYIRIEQGHVVEVRGNGKSIALKKSDGSMPWIDNGEYAKGVSDWEAQTRSHYWKRDPEMAFYEKEDPNASDAQRDALFRQTKKEAYDNIPPHLQRILMTNLRYFPEYLLKWMEARGLTHLPEYTNLEANFKAHGTAYEDLTLDYNTKKHIHLYKDDEARLGPGIQDAYFLITRSQPNNPIGISTNGDFLQQDSDGVWVRAAFQTGAVERAYYDKYPTAMPSGAEERIGQAKTHAEEMQARGALLNEIRIKAGYVESALQGTPIGKLKQVALALIPEDHAHHQQAQKMQKGQEEAAILGIKTWLDYYTNEGNQESKTRLEQAESILALSIRVNRIRKELSGKPFDTLQAVAKALIPENNKEYKAMETLKADKEGDDQKMIQGINAWLNYYVEDEPSDVEGRINGAENALKLQVETAKKQPESAEKAADRLTQEVMVKAQPDDTESFEGKEAFLDQIKSESWDKLLTMGVILADTDQDTAHQVEKMKALSILMIMQRAGLENQAKEPLLDLINNWLKKEHLAKMKEIIGQKVFIAKIPPELTE